MTRRSRGTRPSRDRHRAAQGLEEVRDRATSVGAGALPAARGGRAESAGAAVQAFPLFSFSARALKFASRPGSELSASAFSMNPGTSEDSFRSIVYVASVVPACAPGLSVHAPSLPFIISPFTMVHVSLLGFSAVCLSV